MNFNLFKGKRNAKVSPSIPVSEEETERPSLGEGFKMRVVRLHTVFKLYGGQKHPRIETYETLKERGEIVEYRYVRPSSTIVYVYDHMVRLCLQICGFVDNK